MNPAVKTNGPKEWLQALRRRRTAAAVAGTAVFVTAALTAALWPAKYRATGVILIEQQQVPTDLVHAAISSYADQRIQVITQRVMTTENLFKIIDRYGLYARLRQTAPRERIIKRMRDDINFGMISADVIDPREGRPVKASIAFSVSFTNSSPDVSARVANELVSLYLQVNIENRRREAASSATFLSDEAQALEQKINDIQAKIAAFKQQNLGALPEQSVINTQLLDHTEDELRDIDTQIRTIDQQVQYLDGQIATQSPSSQVYTSTGERVLSPADRLKYLRTEYATLSSTYSPDHPDVIRMQREIEGLEAVTGNVNSSNDLNRQLETAQSDLAAAQQRYAPSHPDVIKLQRQVDTLKAGIAKAAQTPYVSPSQTAKPDNPAYIQLQAQEQAAVNERASLVQRRASVEAKIGEYEDRLTRAPSVERDYLDMQRELDNNQLEYRQIRQKQLTAQESQSLENEDKGERFSLIEPPVPPQEPSSPNRLAILLIGLVLAIGSAVGLTALIESLDTSIRNRNDLELLLAVPPLAVLPAIRTRADQRILVRNRRLGIAGLVATIAIGLTMTHLFYKPLDVIWTLGVRRLLG